MSNVNDTEKSDHSDSSGPASLRWVFLQDADSAPYVVASAIHGLYLINPVWRDGEEFPRYGVFFVPNDALLDGEGYAHHESLQTLEPADHWLTAEPELRLIAQAHYEAYGA